MLEAREITHDAYISRVGSLKVYLRKEHGIFLDSVVGIGYMVLPPGDEITVPEEMTRQAMMRIRRAGEMCGDIRIDRIEDAARKSYVIDRSQAIASLAGMIKAGTVKFGNSDARMERALGTVCER